MLIRAAPLVLREIPATTFLFVGEGPQRLTLEALANRFGVARNVVFAGVRRDMPEVYASLDVVTLPSRTEGMPMCLLEAMAASRPVIATPVGSIPKLIFPKQTGLLVAQDDPSDLAKKILHIASNPGQARVMAERARQHVGVHYSAESMATKYIRLYEEAATLLEGQAQRGGVHGEVCHR